MRRVHLSQREAEGFYAVHRERPFFGSLTDFMSSGPHCPGARSAGRHQEVAHADGRDRPGQGRRRHASQGIRRSIERNATHGSDAPETAAFEIGYFFAGMELAERTVRSSELRTWTCRVRGCSRELRRELGRWVGHSFIIGVIIAGARRG